MFIEYSLLLHYNNLSFINSSLNYWYITCKNLFSIKDADKKIDIKNGVIKPKEYHSGVRVKFVKLRI